MDETKPKCEHRRQSLPGVAGGEFPCAEPECPEGEAGRDFHVPIRGGDGLWYEREKREDGTWGWVIATDRP